MTYGAEDLIEEINGTIFWRSSVLDKHPEDIRNRIAMHRLKNLQEQLQTINDPDLELALNKYQSQDMEMIQYLHSQSSRNFKTSLFLLATDNY